MRLQGWTLHPSEGKKILVKFFRIGGLKRGKSLRKVNDVLKKRKRNCFVVVVISCCLLLAACFLVSLEEEEEEEGGGGGGRDKATLFYWPSSECFFHCRN